MLKLLRDLIQNKIPILVYNEDEVGPQQHHSIKNLRLYRSIAPVTIANQRLPCGSYLLLDVKKEEAFLALGNINSQSQEGEKANIKAYVLSFGGGQTRDLQVADSTIDLIVTERLTGCTFAAELDTATPLVLHINKLGVDGRADQAKIDDIIKRRSRGNPENFFTIKKADYNIPGISPEGAYPRVFAATVMGFREKLEGRPDRWSFISQYSVYHSAQMQCVGKRGKKCEYRVVKGRLEKNITDNPMDMRDDISRENYSRLLPTFFEQARTPLLIALVVALVGFLIYWIAQQYNQSLPSITSPKL